MVKGSPASSHDFDICSPIYLRPCFTIKILQCLKSSSLCMCMYTNWRQFVFSALTGVVSSEKPKTIYGNVRLPNGKMSYRKVSKVYQITVLRVFRGKEILLGKKFKTVRGHSQRTPRLSKFSNNSPYEIDKRCSKSQH